jgi:hypothetical protein
MFRARDEPQEVWRKAALSHIGFADCAGRTFQRRLDIGDPQIPPTRLFSNGLA